MNLFLCRRCILSTSLYPRADIQKDGDKIPVSLSYQVSQKEELPKKFGIIIDVWNDRTYYVAIIANNINNVNSKKTPLMAICHL